MSARAQVTQVVRVQPSAREVILGDHPTHLSGQYDPSSLYCFLHAGEGALPLHPRLSVEGLKSARSRQKRILSTATKRHSSSRRHSCSPSLPLALLFSRSQTTKSSIIKLKGPAPKALPNVGEAQSAAGKQALEVPLHR